MPEATHIRANLRKANAELRDARALEKAGQTLPLGQDVNTLEAVVRTLKHLIGAQENNEGIEGFTRRLRQGLAQREPRERIYPQLNRAGGD